MMVYRKGELSAASIDREWPHQIAITADPCTGERHAELHAFCKDLSLTLRAHTFVQDSAYINA